ncbi:beta-1,4-mannosyl-glycoprotein 4-beta-N-acetylglucosaminyltransferase-like [Triplophysa dalaica]|uniref:beta-1,4-mannosyl-glycoprotein 4-beta-N-acetylglucosaminyltransferase a n=1 Tax=Triplophysa dalaica TaxID=1582913 RepID=UPI0024DF678A|nr:beta-1,4-mannosyl-glycoprotein 4-beta-N-acetylglucosaminyltransferase a [Triplophysa dalaica]XP_056609407.1 beta-1,4-mannosyl-glycoprotein 4-beta-N-acetylglucosaminyltransferase a [Triplophysa dalaica]XP_056609408.1 beta-1,4-mannosyl-glycoprotein 4-beta-N-acetylglucosaminyltransferase-like [Triplophysa dalaica]XP_056609409.1 beta-1,4-mannosyl-glycoprotein 4-beta-N-acetylglucosaminyltransferase-like [Triplophysa dalaica]
MRIKKIRCCLLCILGLCFISFQYYYKALHNIPLLQEFSSPSLHLNSLKMVGSFFWNVPDINFYKHHLKAFVESSVIQSDSTVSTEKLHNQRFVLQDDHTPFFVRTKSGATCFREGTKMGESASQRILLHYHGEDNATVKRRANADQCTCLQGWHGPHCGIPTIVQHSNLPTKTRLTPRATPRRVINAININHEFDLLHARFHELADVVDVFLVCESNFTAYGDQRPLYFQQQLQNGTFDYIKHKILYIFLDHFPNGGRLDGWIADDYLRTYLTKNGMLRIQGAKADDIFVIDDADEIPAREGILFLKLYDGWTEPVGIHMRKSLYGFYWKQFGTLNILSCCTVAMLSKVYKNDGILLRRRTYYTMPGFREYENSTGKILVPWAIGSPVHYAGWHCSWCFKPEGIYYKLISAQNGDFPRWGDYGEKLKLHFIKKLIQTGGWFDGSLPDYPPTDPKEHMYAPKHLMDNYEKYRHLLENPFANLDN